MGELFEVVEGLSRPAVGQAAELLVLYQLALKGHEAWRIPGNRLPIDLSLLPRGSRKSLTVQVKGAALTDPRGVWRFRATNANGFYRPGDWDLLALAAVGPDPAIAWFLPSESHSCMNLRQEPALGISARSRSVNRESRLFRGLPA